MIRNVLACAAALSLSFAVAHAQTPAPAAAAAPATEGTIAVHLRGLTANKGSVILMLFDNNDNYEASKPVQSTKIDATAAAADASFTGVAPGRYAIKVIYDINGNGAYDQGTDGIGFSNHVTMTDALHVPTFSETSFFVKAGANTQQITVAPVRS
jgi:uncharacterized protein (DUF2141 family)